MSVVYFFIIIGFGDWWRVRMFMNVKGVICNGYLEICYFDFVVFVVS